MFAIEGPGVRKSLFDERRLRRRRAGLETWHVSALRYGEDLRFVLAFSTKIVVQFGAKMPRLDPHNVVLLGIERRSAPEDRPPDLDLVDFAQATGEGTTCHKQQEFTKLRGSGERTTGSNSLD